MIGQQKWDSCTCCTSAVVSAHGALVWHCRAAVGGDGSSQQELWPYPFSSPLFIIISAVAVHSWLQKKRTRIYMKHMAIVSTAAPIMPQPPPLLCFPCIQPSISCGLYAPGKQRWKMQFSIQLAMSEFVYEVRVMVGIDGWFRG